MLRILPGHPLFEKYVLIIADLLSFATVVSFDFHFCAVGGIDCKQRIVSIKIM